MPYSNERRIAMTDLETTGDIPAIHEILEIGLIVFDPRTFEIVDTYNQKVKPEHIETAKPAALKWNGYKEEDWKDAISLKEAFKIYGEKTNECLFMSYNVSFDWAFVVDAFHKAELPNPMSTFENHDRLDLLSIAWERGLKNEKSLSLKTACEVFGVPPEPIPHNALSGAIAGYELFKKLSQV